MTNFLDDVNIPMSRALKRQSLIQYLNKSLLRVYAKNVRPRIDFDYFSDLSKQEKIFWLEKYGYKIVDNYVIACKGVENNYSCMTGQHIFDEVLHIYGGKYEVCIWRTDRIRDGEIKDEYKILYKGKKYYCLEVPTKYEYSRHSFDDHCRGLWSSHKHCILYSKHVKKIEVMYDLDDPNLTLNYAGHLRSLKLKVAHIRPSWRYDVNTIGKSFIFE